MSVDIIDPYINYGKLPLDDSEDSPLVGINIQEGKKSKGSPPKTHLPVPTEL
jgi:hypothetical protein